MQAFFYSKIMIIADKTDQNLPAFAEKIRSKLSKSGDFDDKPYVSKNETGLEISWCGRWTLDEPEMNFLAKESKKFPMLSHEATYSEGWEYTRTMGFKNGKEEIIFEDDRFFSEPVVPKICSDFALWDEYWKSPCRSNVENFERKKNHYEFPNRRLSEALTNEDRDFCRESLLNITNILSVVMERKLLPTNDEIPAWLEVREFLADIDEDLGVDEDRIQEGISYIEKAVLKTRYGVDSLSERHAATV